MSSQVTRTPSPPLRVNTPDTPRFGAFGDTWEPYSPRKSARISSRQRDATSNRTPSPRPSTHKSRSTHSSRLSTFSTPAASPLKKRAPAMDSIRRASGTLTHQSTAQAADFLGISSTTAPTSSPAKTNGTAATHANMASEPHRMGTMLPTPAKTPRKQPDEKTEASIRDVARNLFSADSADPSAARKKKPKKYTGLTLDSFRAEEVEEDIQIFTDSRDRLPEVDTSSENPFYGENSVDSEPTKRRSPRKKVLIPGEGRISVSDAVKREDGNVYVFRGKAIWKPSGVTNAGDELDVDGIDNSALEAEGSGSPPRRSTRSSIKPRLLFPPPQKQEDDNLDHVDEEAPTDIEDHIMINDMPSPEDPLDTPKEDSLVPDTPAAPRFAPASPPTTGRATRTSKKLLIEELAQQRPVKSRSPFDSWRRSKSGPSASQSQKREGDPLPTQAQAAPKRPRV